VASEIAEGVSPRAAGVRVIVTYKVAKALAEGTLAILLTVMIATGYTDRAADLAETMRNHLVHPWSIRLAEWVMRSLTSTKIWWLVAALAGDAIVSGLEGWALARGFSWAAWLVVAATSLLLPVEIIEIAHHTTIGRVLLFGINLAIVLYLLRRAMKEHHLQHPHHGR
jgi:uncharacterized membrane protein (DUF2068 family)